MIRNGLNISRYILSRYGDDPSDFNERNAKIVSEYDQEIPQSQTTDNSVAPRGRAAQP